MNYVDICMQFVPRKVLEHMKKSIQAVKIEVLRNSWEVRIMTRGRFSVDWKQCAMENSLQPNDVCVFELVDNKNSVFKLTIFRNLVRSNGTESKQ